MDDEAKIAELESAFARGDYSRVKHEALPLAESTKNEGVRTRALELVGRLKPDPIAIVLFVIAAVLLAAMTTYFELRSRP
ncbi:MAG: hypothetical protein ABI183_01675 [Polyangiaceae bacterium]